MLLPDFVNGLFEFAGGVGAWMNVRQIRKDQMVRGISGFVWVFTLWGFWNLFYYPSLDQWASFAGGVVIVAGNSLWLYHVWKYRNA